MKKHAVRLSAILVLSAFLSHSSEGLAADPTHVISLGTATVSGNWYPTGGYVCDLVNKARQMGEHNIHCSVQSTGGAVVNMRAIRSGDLQLAFAVAEVQSDAYKGTGTFKDEGPNDNLRFVMSLYPEAFHLVVHKAANINHFRDVKGKRVAAGPPGASSRETAHLIMKYFGIDPNADIIDVPLTFREVAAALCDDKIDAIIFASGVPTPLVQEATNTCDAKLAPIDGAEIDKMLSENPYFTPITIPGDTYPGTDKDVKTIGSATTLVSSAEVGADVVYNVVKSLYDNFEAFKQQRPFYKLMSREASANVARVGVPYHEGARRFFEEHKLIK